MLPISPFRSRMEVMMTENQKNLGKLERVELRDVWSDEAQDFTPWLAGEDGLDLLGKTLGMDLEIESQEKRVGAYSADILCINTDDDSRVLIENQLEKTNHRHLGQLLTYAAGLEAVSVIWIASKFTDEHRASLDWLNEITDEKFQFFGLEIELWKIEKSEPAPKFNISAPKFNIISKPNKWSRDFARKSQNESLTPTKILQQKFWQSLKDHGENNGCKLRFQNPRAQHWYNFGAGKTGTKLVALVNSKTQQISVGFEGYDKNATYYFDKIHKYKDKIEAELGFSLNWDRQEDNLRSAISISREGDFTDQSKWPGLHEWIIKNLEKMDEVFRPIVKQIDNPPEFSEDE